MTREEILKAQIGSWAFDDVTDRQPGILTAMDYVDFILLRLLPGSTPVSKDHPEREVLYNQFIEQQNK